MFFITLFAVDISAYSIQLEIHGERVDVQPILIDNHISIPLRLVAEPLGFSVEWDEQNKIALLEKSDFVAQVQIDNNEILVNESVVSLVVPARLIDERTMMSLDDIAEVVSMDVIWNELNGTIFVLEPFAPIENWPEHLPEHIPGSIMLRPPFELGRHRSEPPMRFRHAFYGIHGAIADLVGLIEVETIWLPISSTYINEDINELMHFVQFFDISREDFDAAVEESMQFRIERGLDLTDEFWELPNADIIFTFDNDLIRYFYRRE